MSKELDRVHNEEMANRGAVTNPHKEIETFVKKAVDYSNPRMPGYVPDPFPIEAIGCRAVVLVQPRVSERVTKGGIIIQDKADTAGVAKGMPVPGMECRAQVMNANPEFTKITGAEKGDMLFVNSYCNVFVKVNGYNYMIVTNSDVFGKEVGETNGTIL